MDSLVPNNLWTGIGPWTGGCGPTLYPTWYDVNLSTKLRFPKTQWEGENAGPFCADHHVIVRD